MLPIRDLHSCIIICSTLQAAPSVDNLLQHRSSIPNLDRIWHRQLHIFVLTVEKTRVALIEVHPSERWRSRPCPYRVACFLRNPPKYISANVPTAQGVQVPVGGYGSDGGVVVIKRGVSGANK